jgi:hypothetical protein
MRERGQYQQMIKRVGQTRITVRKSEVIVIQKSQGVILADCPQCNRHTEMLSAEQAVTLTGISSLNLFKLVESGQVHFLETSQGHLLICLESLGAGSQPLKGQVF